MAYVIMVRKSILDLIKPKIYTDMVMKVTMNDVYGVFTKMINGEITREDADCWAYKCIQADDDGSLIFEPKSDELHIWSAIKYLYGVDMQLSPGEYMHTLEDIRADYEENWGDC